MAQVGWISDDQQEVSFDDALAVSEAEGSWNDIPHEVLVLIREQVTKERPDGISVTQLLGCLRRVYLEKQADWYTHPRDNWPAFRGTIVHALLEDKGGDNVTVEERVERTFEGVTISGQPDSVRVIGTGKRRLLRDWKSTAKLPIYDNAYSSHRIQTNIYRWLMKLATRFTEIEIVYVSMEGIKVIPLKKGGVTRYGRQIENQVWSDEQVEDYLRSRLLPLQAQFTEGRPIPYAEVPSEDLCYRLAADEQHEPGEGRVIPRSK